LDHLASAAIDNISDITRNLRQAVLIELTSNARTRSGDAEAKHSYDERPASRIKCGYESATSAGSEIGGISFPNA